MTCSQLWDSSLQSLIGFIIGGMIGLNHRDEFPMALQEIGFLVMVTNRHHILSIRDQNLLSRSYETVIKRYSKKRR